MDDENLNELFRAFDAGELDDEPGSRVAPLTSAERGRLLRAAAFVGTAVDAPLPSPGLRATVLAAVRAEAASEARVQVTLSPLSPSSLPDVASAPVADRRDRRRRRAGRRRWQLVAVGVAVASAVAVAIVVRRPAPAPVELAGAKLRAADIAQAPDAEGEVLVFAGPHGEIVKIEAEHLQVSSDGQVYQCWFVGPGDKPDAQVRIAIGTFRTNDGTINIQFPSAVDRAKYPTFAITLEPDDGDPRQNGPMIVDAVPVPDGPNTTGTTR